MAKTNIGRVSVVPKDEYSSTENYKRLDVVSGDGSMYISKKDNNIGNPLTDENWWFKAVEKGEVGPQGDKPVNGVDYNTPEEKEEFKDDVVSAATTEVEQNIANIQEQAIQEFNSNASTKTNEYNSNTTTKLSEYNTNANSKVEEYNSNATQKTNTFNENATTQTETFNNNATSKTNDFNSNSSSKTDEFNTNYEEKLESINEASTSIEQERTISDGKYARALKTPVADVESTQIYAENDLVNDLVVNGVELTQETREGYNLLSTENLQELNENGITLTKENGIVTLNGQSTSANFIDDYFIGNSSNYEEFLTAGTYLISGITGGVLSPNFGITVVIKHVDESTTTIIQNNENKSFTVREGDTFRIFIRIPQNLQLNNIVIKPMIVSGTENKDFEEYGVSPSLDFPSEVQVASEQNIQICKNNYLNTTQIANKDFSNSGLTVTTDENGIFTVNGTNTNRVNIDFSNLNFKVKQGQKVKLFKISGSISQSDNILNYINVLLWDNEYNTLALLNINNSNVNYTDIVNRIQIGFLVPSSTSSITYTDFKFGIMVVNADDTIQDYQPYYGIDITIPLTNSAIGQYTDTIDRENSVQNKFIQELTLTGSESDWGREDTSVGTRFFKPLKNSIIANATSNESALCSHFKLALEGETYNNIKELFAIYNVGSTNRISFGSFTDMSTVEEWKAKLKELYDAGTPVKVYYVAETPTKNSLQEEVQTALSNFKLYQDLNNVAIDGGSMSFIYNKSLLRALKEQSELSASLLERIQALEQAQVDNVGGN